MVFHSLNAGESKMSYEEIGWLTLPQYLNAVHEGKPPKIGVKKATTAAEARELAGL